MTQVKSITWVDIYSPIEDRIVHPQDSRLRISKDWQKNKKGEYKALFACPYDGVNTHNLKFYYNSFFKEDSLQENELKFKEMVRQADYFEQNGKWDE